jgi:hypothetical protein
LPFDPSFAGSNPIEDDGFLRVIKIHSMNFFRAEVKLAVPCHKILQHVKNPYSMKEMLVDKINGHILASFSHFATRCLLVTATELWWVNQE